MKNTLTFSIKNKQKAVRVKRTAFCLYKTLVELWEYLAAKPHIRKLLRRFLLHNSNGV